MNPARISAFPGNKTDNISLQGLATLLNAPVEAPIWASNIVLFLMLWNRHFKRRAKQMCCKSLGGGSQLQTFGLRNWCGFCRLIEKNFHNISITIKHLMEMTKLCAHINHIHIMQMHRAFRKHRKCTPSVLCFPFFMATTYCPPYS